MTPITVPQIKGAVAAYFSTTVLELTGSERTQIVSCRRAVAFHLCNELTDVSYLQIGREFGGRDHTSVLRALGKPLDMQHQIAFDRLHERLLRGTNHTKAVVQRWQFKSRRKRRKPLFIRRYTAGQSVETHTQI